MEGPPGNRHHPDVVGNDQETVCPSKPGAGVGFAGLREAGENADVHQDQARPREESRPYQ